jgi:hypothetical protein
MSERRVSILPRDTTGGTDETTRPGTMRSMTVELARMNDAVQDVAESQLELKSNVDAVLAKLATVEDEIKKRPQISRRAVWIIAGAAVAIAIRLWTSPAPGNAPRARPKHEQQQHGQQYKLYPRHIAPAPLSGRPASIASDAVHIRNVRAGSYNAVKLAAGLGSA